jgi:hypothetical protein
MQMPSMLEGESLKRLLQGAAAGAVATIFVGFYWGGWSLGEDRQMWFYVQMWLPVWTSVVALLQVTATVPIVSTFGFDPVAHGLTRKATTATLGTSSRSSSSRLAISSLGVSVA